MALVTDGALPLKHYKSFETERLLIRPTGMQDALFIHRLMNSPKWLQFIGDRKVDTPEKARSYIRDKMLPQLERLGFSAYTVILKENGQAVGNCGLYDREGLDGIDIGFAFLPEHEGKGYAREASERLLRAAREDFAIEKVLAITNTDNIRSQKLLEKLGLKQKGRIRLKDEGEELLMYSIKLSD